MEFISDVMAGDDAALVVGASMHVPFRPHDEPAEAGAKAGVSNHEGRVAAPSVLRDAARADAAHHTSGSVLRKAQAKSDSPRFMGK